MFAIEDGRAAVPPVDVEDPEVLSEMPCPSGLPRHVNGRHLAGAEDGVDALAIRHRTGAGEVVLVVHGWQGALSGQLVGPQPSAVRGAEGFDREAHGSATLLTLLTGSSAERPLRGRGVGALAKARSKPRRASTDLRGDKDALAPDDRRRNADSRQGGLPGNILRVAPLQWQRGLWGRAGVRGSAPLRPVGRREREAQDDGPQENGGDEPGRFDAGVHGETLH